ncbi:hypothetical protein [Bacillus sp. FJAT-27445]|uniref:hypothetical protein n=1 Tax=Bacillus sp. FJAT-27445 TaxID=1679166 RepID=UPI000744435C|nr:hypothetical protein [Bacillus sp. FJAT-27445]
MRNDVDIVRENEIIEQIERIIKEKQAAKQAAALTPAIKKQELESYLEELAKHHSLHFAKKSSPFKTTYLFPYESHKVEVEIYYRYSNFYTRHTATILSVN